MRILASIIFALLVLVNNSHPFTLKLEIAVDAALLERLVRAFVLIGETPPENWLLEKRDG